jgi:H+/Na+-translocating ferredoxin:NAD+ oxidoreductase subunit D
MEKHKLIVSHAPFIKQNETIEKIMYTVVLSLMPALFVAYRIFGIRALSLTGVCVISCIVFEYLCNVLRKQSPTCFDGSAIITGVLLAFNLPPTTPYWMAALGSFVAIVIAKQLFGGLGFNLFNPALVARVFLLISFPVALTKWTMPMSVDMTTVASPLGILKTEGVAAISNFNLWYGFFGNISGSLGETSVLALLIGALILLFKRYITWQIPFSFIATTYVFTWIFHTINPSLYASPDFHLVTGGLILGAFFMATDMVTSPMTSRAQIIFGMGCGLLTGIIRLFGGYPEGVSFAILIMNAFVPLLDKWDAYSKAKRRKA